MSQKVASNPVRVYVCNKCNRAFSNRMDINKHKLTHRKIRPYKCEICGNNYSEETRLNVHRSQVHGVEKRSHVICNGVPHVLPPGLPHDVTPGIPGSVSASVPSHHASRVGQLHCSSYTNKTNSVSDTEYSCGYCGKVFSNKINLKHHEMTHMGTKPHQCPACYKTFSYKDNLIMHLKVHKDMDLKL